MGIHVWCIAVGCVGVVRGQLPLNHAARLVSRHEKISPLNNIGGTASHRHPGAVVPEINWAVVLTYPATEIKGRGAAILVVELDYPGSEVRAGIDVVKYYTTPASQGHVVALVH